jgi:flagellar biosynthetic protein FliQ
VDSAAIVDLARQALMVTLLVALPLLAVALALGLLVGIFQAATSINEMTLTFVPKLIFVGIALSIFGGWQINIMVDFTRSIFERIPALFS